MTPTEIMAALEGNGPLPREALEAAGQSRDAMVPVFLDYIGKLQTAKIGDLDRMSRLPKLADQAAEGGEGPLQRFEAGELAADMDGDALEV